MSSAPKIHFLLALAAEGSALAPTRKDRSIDSSMHLGQLLPDRALSDALPQQFASEGFTPALSPGRGAACCAPSRHHVSYIGVVGYPLVA
jgi:hypothetical protein